jgi:signal transduction histidine kinase/CheY-like chemotaxis protein
LVDDTPANLVALEAILGGRGYRLVTATSGEEALERLRTETFAVILTDVMMPGMDGFRFAVLARRGGARETPIIFLTALASDGNFVTKAYLSGAVDYLLKPLQAEIVQAKVAVFVELFRARLERERSEAALRKAKAELEVEVKGRTAELEEANHSLRASQAGYRFLAEAGALLSASLDYEATLESLAGLAVPRLADWCVVDMLDERGQIRRLAVMHVEQEKEALARELGERYPPSLGDPNPPATVLRSGKAEVAAEISAELLEGAAEDEEHLKIIKALGLKSYMCVPLLSHGRTLGAITFVSAESGRRFGERDLQLAEELARRAALAVENARLFRQATAANRAKDEFLATVSHELRTPMNVMLGWLELLKKGATEDVPHDEVVTILLRNARLQAKLIEDLLDVSRVVSGKLKLSPKVVDIAPAVRGAVEAVALAAEAKGIDVKVKVDPAIGVVSADPERLQQVLWNLLSNAIKFTPKGGTVEVSARRSQSMVEVTVRDTGQGIDASFLPFVFDRFRQEDGGTTRHFGGLGLGLAIARHLVELHGGTVWAESAGKGKGAAFSFTLPLMAVRLPTSFRPEDAEVAEAGRDQRWAPPADDLSGVKILVVDDAPDVLTLLKAILKRHGAEVFLAQSAAAALEVLERRRPDVLLSDIGMPEEDGLALIRKVRALGEGSGGRIPAAALTAYTREEERSLVLSSGFQMHLAKPVDPEVLVSAVARLVGRA